MASYFNSNSQVMSLRSVEELEQIVSKSVRVSGMFEALSVLSNRISYDFDYELEDLKLWNIRKDKAMAQGSNQHLIGQTENKLAYDLSKALGDGEYAAGIFTSKVDIVNSQVVIEKEKQFGQSALNQMWVEFDQHILGNISPDTTVGLAKKLNKGLFDYITNIDNSVFGTSAIDNTQANRQKIYKLAVKKAGELNESNDRNDDEVSYLIVSGVAMKDLFRSPYNENSANLISLADMLAQRNILVIYLSNQSDKRDYAILSIPSAFDLYSGLLPFRVERLQLNTKNIMKNFIEVFYAYNNPFLVPNLEGELGMIINGGATGINSGATRIITNSTPEQAKEVKETKSK